MGKEKRAPQSPMLIARQVIANTYCFIQLIFGYLSIIFILIF